MGDVIYTGIFLNDVMQSAVRSYFMAMSGSPLLSDVCDCHCTLKFEPLIADVDRLPFGKNVKLRVVGYSQHEYVQCLLIDILDDEVRKMCVNECAHITVSYNKSKVRPNYVNTLLKNGKIVPVINNFDVRNCGGKYDEMYRNDGDGANGGLVVEGRVGAFYKNPNGGVCFKQKKRHKKRGNYHNNSNGW